MKKNTKAPTTAAAKGAWRSLARGGTDDNGLQPPARSFQSWGQTVVSYAILEGHTRRFFRSLNLRDASDTNLRSLRTMTHAKDHPLPMLPVLARMTYREHELFHQDFGWLKVMNNLAHELDLKRS